MMADAPQQQASPTQEPARQAYTTSPLLGAEKLLIALFVFFVMLTVFLIAIQSNWYYFTFALSLVVLLVTYKEGLVAMDDQE